MIRTACPNHSKEGAGRSEGNLSWWDTAGVFRDVQTLNEHV